MPFKDFNKNIRPMAKEIYRKSGNSIVPVAMLGYSNICRNRCAYCGMNAGNRSIKRYRIPQDDILSTVKAAARSGIKRFFLISGDDPNYNFPDLYKIIEYGKSLNLYITLAAGELDNEQLQSLENAGLDEYVLKFETTDNELFRKIKPDSSLKKRMDAINLIKNGSMELASGNITGLPEQSLESIADDIIFMKALEVSWAPVVPYMPVPGTPLAEGNSRGSLEIILKEIAILRLMIPSVNITAQQPGDDIKNGFGDIQGNLNALNAGANMLFVDMLPSTLAGEFKVIENRNVEGLERISKMAEMSGMAFNQAEKLA